MKSRFVIHFLVPQLHLPARKKCFNILASIFLNRIASLIIFSCRAWALDIMHAHRSHFFLSDANGGDSLSFHAQLWKINIFSLGNTMKRARSIWNYDVSIWEQTAGVRNSPIWPCCLLECDKTHTSLSKPKLFGKPSPHKILVFTSHLRSKFVKRESRRKLKVNLHMNFSYLLNFRDFFLTRMKLFQHRWELYDENVIDELSSKSY